MNKYKIRVELLSETILGNGEAVAGYIDLDVLHDELGLPFLKGKTLKGRLREESENIVRLQKNIFSEKQVKTIFGEGDNEGETVLALSDCTVATNIRRAIKASSLSDSDILDSLTEVRSFTAIDSNGIAKEGSLRQMRVINKGLKLYSEVSFMDKISQDDILLLGLSVLSLKYIGLMGSRGKGNVKCTILENDKDITNKLINEFREKVK